MKRGVRKRFAKMIYETGGNHMRKTVLRENVRARGQKKGDGRKVRVKRRHGWKGGREEREKEEDNKKQEEN